MFKPLNEKILNKLTPKQRNLFSFTPLDETLIPQGIYKSYEDSITYFYKSLYFDKTIEYFDNIDSAYTSFVRDELNYKICNIAFNLYERKSIKYEQVQEILDFEFPTYDELLDYYKIHGPIKNVNKRKRAPNKGPKKQTKARFIISQIDPKTNEVIATYNFLQDAAKAVGGSGPNIYHSFENSKRKAYGFKWKREFINKQDD